MDWFPVLAASALAMVTALGADHPSRALTLIFFLALACLVWMAIEGWKMLRPSETPRNEVARS